VSQAGVFTVPDKGVGEVVGNSMNDIRKEGGLQTVLQQQQSKKLL